ncbi:proton-conducting transporter transmembrane domain-containing protein [Paludisphaera rhizosphaerae]|uniref:proton-conducting transporter transmembrane domain-containing protein n=1 Tax=Paludisphaera rhizosphaerae TaxID=2711216 RepID=UPI0013EC7FA1|nr:proton-conducting transporter membrane subunit [Paludisphaera rhizosphaerae]
MAEFRFPWLSLSVLICIVGAVWDALARTPDVARRRSLGASGLALGCTLAAWLDFVLLGAVEAHDPWSLTAGLLGSPLLALDPLSAPKLPLVALVYFLTNLATLRAKAREFSFARSLAAEAILLATFACKTPWAVAALLAIGTIPPFLELSKAGKPKRVYVVHAGLFVGLLALGAALLETAGDASNPPVAAIMALALAMLVRSGVAPFHCWMTDLFEHATFGTALLFVAPMPGVYGAMRLVLPFAPSWILQAVSMASLATAVYTAGMALVQREARRFFCYLFLSHASLVLVGLETASPIGVAGALCLWLSAALSLTGFGLTMRCVESRMGRVSLSDFSGLYRHVPMLAALFLITGLASVGFPGTVGFIGLEMLVDGAVQSSPVVGAIVVIVAALNGLAVIHAYFRIFTGRPHASSIELHIRPAERASVLVLTALILGGGLYPQPGVESRYHAAVALSRSRRSHARSPVDPAHGAAAGSRLPSGRVAIDLIRARS